jgi:membrane protease YdiL (CAAX protease family)
MKKFSWFKFSIGKEIYVVLLMWCLVVSTLYTAFQIFTTARVAANFITFGFGTILICGIGLPLAYMKIIKGKNLDSLGISKNKIIPSIVLGIFLTTVQYSQTLANQSFPDIRHLVPIVPMGLAVDLFENIFFRGWMQLRFEEAFGLVPSILLASVFYSLYHIGYGMTWSEMYELSYVGLFYAVVFRFTQNIFVLYPFLTPSGALYTNIKEGLMLPFEATYGFVIVIALSITAIIFFGKTKIFTKQGGVINV